MGSYIYTNQILLELAAILSRLRIFYTLHFERYVRIGYIRCCNFSFEVRYHVWFSLAHKHKHKHKKLRSKWEHQNISIRAYAGAVLTKFLDTSFPQLPSRWRIEDENLRLCLILMLISLAFALRHKNNINTRRTNHVRSSCAYACGCSCLCKCLCLCLACAYALVKTNGLRRWHVHCHALNITELCPFALNVSEKLLHHTVTSALTTATTNNMPWKRRWLVIFSGPICLLTDVVSSFLDMLTFTFFYYRSLLTICVRVTCRVCDLAFYVGYKCGICVLLARRVISLVEYH